MRGRRTRRPIWGCSVCSLDFHRKMKQNEKLPPMSLNMKVDSSKWLEIPLVTSGLRAVKTLKSKSVRQTDIFRINNYHRWPLMNWQWMLEKAFCDFEFKQGSRACDWKKYKWGLNNKIIFKITSLNLLVWYNTVCPKTKYNPNSIPYYSKSIQLIEKFHIPVFR